MGGRSSQPVHRGNRCTYPIFGHAHRAQKVSKVVVTHPPVNPSMEEKATEVPQYQPHQAHHTQPNHHLPAHHAKNGADLTRSLSKPDAAAHDEDEVGDMPIRMNEKQYWWDLNGSVKSGSWKEFHISSVVGKKFSGGMHTVSSHPKKAKPSKNAW